MTEIISGLHACKPANTPKVGDVKNFLIESKVGKSGKPYLKIKSSSEEYGGRPYRIVGVSPTGHTDQHQNVSFNLEVELAQNGSQTPQNAPQRASTASGPHSTSTGYEDRSSRIERQHSQSAALAYCAIKGEVPDNKTLRALIDWFEKDIEQSVKIRTTHAEDDGPIVPEEQEEIDF